VRRYETIFILRPDLGENQIKQSLKRVEDIVANGGGDLIETDEWGIRDLAYRIKRERRGYYVRLDYVAGGPVMNEVERNLKLMDESLRHLSVMVEEDADPVKLRGEVEARQRRLAEARAATAAPETPSEPTPEAGRAATQAGRPAIEEAPQTNQESDAQTAAGAPAEAAAEEPGAENPAAPTDEGGADHKED
jgi:small subunit ribosomal protein S6